MKFQDFKAHCVLQGDDPEAVENFIAWVKRNIGIWRMFERVAYRDMQRGNRADIMWTLGEVRRQGKCSVLNAVGPGLARMFNFKHKKDFYQIGKMKTFSEKLAA